MNERALKRLLDDLGRSLDRLAKALGVAADEPLAVDDTIQRFEFTFELFWKLVRRLPARQGVEANSPKAVLQQAYRLGRLDHEGTWLKLLEDRNLTSHTCRGGSGAGDLQPHSRASCGDARVGPEAGAQCHSRSAVPVTRLLGDTEHAASQPLPGRAMARSAL